MSLCLFQKLCDLDINCVVSLSRNADSMDSLHFFLPSFPIGKCSRQHLVFTLSWWMSDFASQWTLVFPCIGVHSRTLFISPFVHLLCQKCLAWMVCEMGGKLPYNSFFVECCCENLFKKAPNILLFFPSKFFSKCLTRVCCCYHLEEFSLHKIFFPNEPSQWLYIFFFNFFFLFQVWIKI